MHAFARGFKKDEDWTTPGKPPWSSNLLVETTGPKASRLSSFCKFVCCLLFAFGWCTKLSVSMIRRSSFDESDAKISVKTHVDDEILKLGRKGLLPRLDETTMKNEKHDEVEAEEEETGGGGGEEDKQHEEEEVVEDDKHEEEEPEDNTTEEKEDEGREGGDDEIDEHDQEKSEVEVEREEGGIETKPHLTDAQNATVGDVALGQESNSYAASNNNQSDSNSMISSNTENTEENTDTTLNEKSDTDNGTDESSDEPAETENANEDQHDPIDSSDSSISLEKDVRNDLDPCA
ncbi:unnamed protein product [Camellia sinensis]